MSLIGRFLDPKNDFAFKQVFGTEKHKDILIHFLNDVLKRTGEHCISDVQFLKTIQDPEIAAKKQSILDILCQEKSGCQFIIEMQVAKLTGFKQRAIYYASRAYVNQMVKGGKYEHLKEVIFIAIIDYELFPNKSHYHSTHQLCDQTTHECDLPELRFEFLELPRFKKQLNEVTTMIEKWCYYFKYAPETTLDELERLVGSDEVIKEAYKALDAASWTADELFLYEQETKSENDALSMLRRAELDGIEKGIEKGREEGREEGLQEGLAQGKAKLQAEKQKIAKNFLSAGVSISVIAKSTGLTETEIEILRDAR